MKTLLKNFKFIVVLLLITPLASCSSDDDNSEPTTAELLAYKWYIVQQEDTSTTPPTVEVADACTQNTYFNFLSDGTLIAESFYLDMSDDCISSGITGFTYILSADGEQIIVEDEMDNIQILGINFISSSSLTLFNTDSPQYLVTFEK